MLQETKNFIAEFDRRDITYDGFISHKDFNRWAEIVYPQLSDITTQDEMIDAISRYDILRMRTVDEARHHLLEDKQMLLVCVRGHGLKVVKPDEQTLFVLQQGAKELSRAFSKMARGLRHVNTALLTDAQRSENSIAQAKVASLRGMATKKMLVGRPIRELEKI